MLKVMSTMRAEQKAKLKEAEALLASTQPLANAGAPGAPAHDDSNSDSESFFDSKEEIYVIFKDNIFTHNPNSTIQVRASCLLTPSIAACVCFIH